MIFETTYFDELGYSETAEIMEEVFNQNLPLFNTHFNCLKLVTEHVGALFDCAGIVDFHFDKFIFGTPAEEQFRYLIFF